MSQKAHFEVEWTTYGSHGSRSSGFLGEFASFEEANLECERLSALHPPGWNESGVSTYYLVVLVRVDEYGNREVEPATPPPSPGGTTEERECYKNC